MPKETVNYNGLSIQIGGQGAVRYGDLEGAIVIAGPYLESDAVFAARTRDQPVILLIGFNTLDEAKNQLLGYEINIRQLTIKQLKWWVKFGDKSKPIGLLPHDGGGMSQPDWGQVLYGLRQKDENKLLLDSVTMNDIMENTETLTLDAMVVQSKALEKRARLLEAIMNRQGRSVTAVSHQISEPFKQKGTTNIVVLFELSDGQTVSIYFHNPDTTPNKITPDDELVSWKWLLNKTDITILVAQERGLDLVPREVARRVMALAEKNSAKFQAANGKRAERLQAIATLKDTVLSKQQRLEQLQSELEQLKAQPTPTVAEPVITPEVTPVVPEPVTVAPEPAAVEPVPLPQPSPDKQFLDLIISGDYDQADRDGGIGDKLADIAATIQPDLIELLTSAVDLYASRLNAIANDSTANIELEAA